MGRYVDPRQVDPRIQTSGDAADGQVPTADGTGGISWADQQGGNVGGVGGGGGGLPAWTADAVTDDDSTLMKAPAFGDREVVPVPSDGTIIGLVVRLSDARTDGELTVTLLVNGTPTDLVATIDGDSDPQCVQAEGDPVDVEACDLVSLDVHTDASWGPSPVDVTVAVTVAVSAGGGIASAGAGFIEKLHAANRDPGATLALEFDDISDLSDMVVVSPNAVPLVNRVGFSKLAIGHPGGDSTDHLTSVMWPMTPPSGSWYVECALHHLVSSANFWHIGLVVANGVTVGSGSQITIHMQHSSNHIRHATFSGYNNRTATTTAHTMSSSAFTAVLYMRIVWEDADSRWRFLFSPNGFVWWSIGTRTSPTFDTSHVGVTMHSWGSNAAAIGNVEYLAVYGGMPADDFVS